MQAKIEILSTALLDEHRLLVNELRSLARRLGLDFGWHYLLDLAWILSQLQPRPGQAIMDAGAGVGVMQWFLAERGCQVISADRMARADLPLRFRGRYRVQGLREQDLLPMPQAIGLALRRGRLGDLGRGLLGLASAGQPGGTVRLYHQDLGSLPDLADNSLDAVVAVSALEHNPPDGLRQVVDELMRVLKPGGALLATLGAARQADWFHAPSHGWCYTADSLRRLFDLPAAPDNYHQYDRLLAALRDCAELRDNLAGFYFKSGENGMPWGKWDPQYLPVGVCKIKME
jgi:SAM-dependent methyltransferase